MNAPRHVSAKDWATINDVFHRALNEPTERRAALIDAACGGNETLRAEVASLLAAHERAGDFIEQPATDLDDLLTRTSGALPEGLLTGRQVGHYRILKVLGEGGMGRVYLAEDTKLGRMVALKALAPRFTADPSRRERLKLEARAAASLSHPGIATVFALEEFDGHLYIASEFVPGETLRDELTRGPLPAARVIETALSIARALAVAHDRGIIHRDLKPENVMRTPDGELKILDFGLARFRDGDSRLTGAGTILGTPAYMSPEQIRGEAVDARSDLFALGVVLYELASGIHPFTGSDVTSTIARILEKEPPRLTAQVPASLSTLPALAELEEIVLICLRKAPDARFRSVHDLIHVLERARAVAQSGGSASVRSSGILGRADPGSAVWWWQFHEVAATIAYGALLVPLWRAREWTPFAPAGLLLFLAGFVAAVAAGTLRLHLVFVARFYPSEWKTQRGHTGIWLRAADVLFVLVLFAATGASVTAHAAMAMLFAGAAVGVLLAFAIIEPATTRAAFHSSESLDGRAGQGAEGKGPR